MGDRANLVVDTRYKEEDDPARVFFYTHWGGYDLPRRLQKGLAKRWRWTDPSYLARILFDAMCQEHGRETGYGISHTFTDNEHDVLVVIPATQTVELHAFDFDINVWSVKGDWKEPLKSWTFEEFVALPAVTWRALDDA